MKKRNKYERRETTFALVCRQHQGLFYHAPRPPPLIIGSLLISLNEARVCYVRCVSKNFNYYQEI